MKNIIAAALLALVSVTAACGSDSKAASNVDRCLPAVDHVYKLTSVGTPSADEQNAMNMIKTQSLAQCRSEGLSQAQLDCILAAKDIPALTKLDDCAAIKSKRPTWLLIP